MTKIESKFFGLLRQYGVKRILTSYDLLLSLFFTAIFGSVSYHGTDLIVVFNSLFTTLVTISAAMVATAMAGLAIISSISDREFLKLMSEAKVGRSNAYVNILFLFWYSPVISALAISSEVLAYVITLEVFQTLPSVVVIDFLKLMVLISIFLFIYSVGTILELVATTMKMGIYRAEFLNKT